MYEQNTVSVRAMVASPVLKSLIKWTLSQTEKSRCKRGLREINNDDGYHNNEASPARLARQMPMETSLLKEYSQ